MLKIGDKIQSEYGEIGIVVAVLSNGFVRFEHEHFGRTIFDYSKIENATLIEAAPVTQEARTATYYAAPLWEENVYELDRGLTEEFAIDVPQHEGSDANNPVIRMWAVTVVAPKGYDLTDKDHARIDELINVNE